MVLQAAPLTYSTLNRIRSQKLVIYQTKILFIREPSFAKMERSMLMAMKMIMPTSTIWLPRHGLKNER